MMVLPVQALSVTRGMVTSSKTSGGVAPSWGLPSLGKILGTVGAIGSTGCSLMPEPLKTTCLMGTSILGG